MKSIFKYNLPLLIILLLTACLRFWRIWDLNYTYDELSAILRARFNSFGELITKGVMPDGHPAGVQLLIWLIGDHVTLLKSLAALAGVVAVYFTYRAAHTLYGIAAGVAASLMLAVMYQPVLWSQQIRPYSFGLAAAAALLWIWSKLISDNNPKLRLYIWFGLVAAVCAYLHYFAALFALLLWLSGVAIRIHRNWMYAAVIAVLAFGPHLAITLQQLREGGLGWLAKPSPAFFVQYLKSVFNQSWLFAAVAGMLFLAGVISAYKRSVPTPKYSVVLLLLFIMPMAVGYLYSLLRVPVLQQSVLLFSLPVLLIFIAGFLAQLPINIFRLGLILIITTGLITLIYGRKHYSLGYQEAWSSALKSLADKKAPSAKIIDGPVDIIEYYWPRYCPGAGPECHVRFLSQNDNYKNKFLKKTKWYQQPFALVLGSGSDPLVIPFLEDHAEITARFSYIGSECLYFKPRENWADHTPVRKGLQHLQGSNRGFYLSDLKPGPYDVIVIKFKPESVADSGEIVTSIHNKQSQIDWRSSHFDAQSPGIFVTDWQYHAIKLADIPGWKPESLVKVNVSDKGRLVKGELRVELSKGNPYLYGLP